MYCSSWSRKELDTTERLNWTECDLSRFWSRSCPLLKKSHCIQDFGFMFYLPHILRFNCIIILTQYNKVQQYIYIYIYIYTHTHTHTHTQHIILILRLILIFGNKWEESVKFQWATANIAKHFFLFKNKNLAKYIGIDLKKSSFNLIIILQPVII